MYVFIQPDAKESDMVLFNWAMKYDNDSMLMKSKYIHTGMYFQHL